MSALNPDQEPNTIVEKSLSRLLQELYKNGNIDEAVRQQVLKSPEYARLMMLLGNEVADDAIEIFEDQHQENIKCLADGFTEQPVDYSRSIENLEILAGIETKYLNLVTENQDFRQNNLNSLLVKIIKVNELIDDRIISEALHKFNSTEFKQTYSTFHGKCKQNKKYENPEAEEIILTSQIKINVQIAISNLLGFDFAYTSTIDADRIQDFNKQSNPRLDTKVSRYFDFCNVDQKLDELIDILENDGKIHEFYIKLLSQSDYEKKFDFSSLVLKSRMEKIFNETRVEYGIHTNDLKPDNIYLDKLNQQKLKNIHLNSEIHKQERAISKYNHELQKNIVLLSQIPETGRIRNYKGIIYYDGSAEGYASLNFCLKTAFKNYEMLQSEILKILDLTKKPSVILTHLSRDYNELEKYVKSKFNSKDIKLISGLIFDFLQFESFENILKYDKDAWIKIGNYENNLQNIRSTEFMLDDGWRKENKEINQSFRDFRDKIHCVTDYLDTIVKASNNKKLIDDRFLDDFDIPLDLQDPNNGMIPYAELVEYQLGE